MSDDFRNAVKSFFTLPGFVAVAIFTIYGTSMIMLLFRPMPMTETAGTVLTGMIGVLTGAVVTIVTFYFGSSKSSQEKDETIKAMTTGDGKDGH